MAKPLVFQVLLLAILSPYLYDRYLALSNIVSNRPGNLQNTYNIKSHDVKFRNRIRNCEDVILEEEQGLAFLSCDPGRDRWNTVMGSFKPEKSENPGNDNGSIWVYDYSTPSLSDEDALKQVTLINFKEPLDFHPLGIEFEAATSTLYVINHSRHSGSTIEIFQVSTSDATATHVRTFTHPLLHAPNAIHTLGNGKLFVTNDHYMRAAVSPVLSKIETFSGLPGGSVVYTDVNHPQDSKLLARVPFANGVTMLNATTLTVASSSKAGIYFYSVNADHTLEYRDYVRTPASADNISRDADGKLLISGHPFAMGLMAVANGRAECDFDGTEAQREACKCSAPSWAAEWSEEGGLRELFRDDGELFCSSSTAVRDVKRGVGFISGLYDRGLFVFRE